MEGLIKLGLIDPTPHPSLHPGGPDITWVNGFHHTVFRLKVKTAFWINIRVLVVTIIAIVVVEGTPSPSGQNPDGLYACSKRDSSHPFAPPKKRNTAFYKAEGPYVRIERSCGAAGPTTLCTKFQKGFLCDTFGKKHDILVDSLATLTLEKLKHDDHQLKCIRE